MHEKSTDVGGIQSQTVQVEGKHADHGLKSCLFSNFVDKLRHPVAYLHERLGSRNRLLIEQVCLPALFTALVMLPLKDNLALCVCGSSVFICPLYLREYLKRLQIKRKPNLAN